MGFKKKRPVWFRLCRLRE